MSKSVSCPVWRPDECEGTPLCPPRCPRFVDEDGTAVLVEPRSPPFDAVDDLPPVDEQVSPDDVTLAATMDGQVVGVARLRPGGGGRRLARIDIAPSARGAGLRRELARQLIAYAVADGADRVVLDADDPEPYERAGFEPVDGGDRLAVSLSDPSVEALTTPPGREASTAPANERAGGRLGPTGAGLPSSPADAPDLSGLFAPERVAVVGATDREGSIGRLLLENLDDYPGEVVPVTPRAEEVFGRPAPSSLSQAGPVDLAVVAVPPDAAVEAVEDAGRCGVENVIVVSAGFDETDEGGSDDEGQRRARRLREVAEAYDLALVGPNSMGVTSTATGLDASFSPRHPPRGSVSLVSQSGAFITAALAGAAERGFGFRHVVSVGNKTVLDEVDLLRYLDCDPGTEVIAAYLEDVADAESFVEVARGVTKPVVVLKSGRTEAGAAAAASHTGSLAGNEVAVDAAFDRAGVVRADSAGELLDFAAALRGSPPAGDGVGIVTNAGGPGVLAADAVAETDLDLVDYGEDTRERLAELLPPGASVGNPVDVLGDADAGRFADAIDAVLADPGVEVGLVTTTPHPLIDYADLIAAVGRRSLAHETPVVACLMDGDLDAAARRALRQYGVPAYDDPSRAAAAAAALREHGRGGGAVDSRSVEIDHERVREIVADARERGRTRLGVESLGILDACGIDVPEWGLATTPEEAGEIARRIGGPVVLKVASPDLAHKADVGGVRVGVDPDRAGAVCAEMRSAVRAAAPEARIDGIVVQAAVDEGVETVVGATDSRFGPLVAFGLGGIFVEHLDDVAFELAPVDRETARGMLDGIDAAPVLRGARGQDSVDREALVDAIVRISALVEAVPEIEELDVNPLIADEEGVAAVDLQVELARD